MLVHLGEEVGVRALLEQPALALELGHHGLVRLVEQAQPVQAENPRDRAGAQGRQRDHEVADHSLEEKENHGLYSRESTRNGARARMLSAAIFHRAALEWLFRLSFLCLGAETLWWLRLYNLPLG